MTTQEGLPALATDEFIAELRQVISEITEPYTELGFSAKQVAAILARLATAERQLHDYQARVIPAETRVVELEHRLLELEEAKSHDD
jgi:chromosome segregation ATPase